MRERERERERDEGAGGGRGQEQTRGFKTITGNLKNCDVGGDIMEEKVIESGY